MGKGLIGNSLSYSMSSILSGRISAEDIDKIYAGTCFTEETMPNLLSQYKDYWDSAAYDRAEKEICEKYGVEKLIELKNGEEYEKAYDEVYTRGDELRATVAREAEELLQKLWDEGKIIQTRYRVPQGQKVKAKVFPGHERHYYGGEIVDEVEIEGKEQGRYDEILCLNGEYYDYTDSATVSLGVASNGLFNNEIELLANQLVRGFSNDDRNIDRIFFLGKMFPQYKDAIEQVSSKLDYGSSEKEVLEMLEEALRQKGEHTAEEIGEGLGDLTQGEIGEALHVITNDRETQKDQHTLE